MAKTLFTGRLTADAEILNAQHGFASFTLAENIGYGDKQKTNFFKCKGNFTEKQLQYLKQGTSIDIVGDINIEISDSNGKKYYNTEVYIIHFEFTQLPKKKEEAEAETK